MSPDRLGDGHHSFISTHLCKQRPGGAPQRQSMIQADQVLTGGQVAAGVVVRTCSAGATEKGLGMGPGGLWREDW